MVVGGQWNGRGNQKGRDRNLVCPSPQCLFYLQAVPNVSTHSLSQQEAGRRGPGVQAAHLPGSLFSESGGRWDMYPESEKDGLFGSLALSLSCPL